MRFTYTYIEDNTFPGRFIYLPLINLNIGEHKIPIRCLVDSGSPITIVHSPLIVASGIIPAAGKKGALYGVGGGKITGYFHQIPVSLFGNEYVDDVFVTAELETPYVLLGQHGFFKKHRITFDLSKLSFEIMLISS